MLDPKNVCLFQGHKDFLLFSSRSIVICGFRIRSMIHFDLVFIYGVRYGSKFVGLLVVVFWVFLFWGFVFGLVLGYPIVPAQFVKNSVFLTELPLYLC